MSVASGSPQSPPLRLLTPRGVGGVAVLAVDSPTERDRVIAGLLSQRGASVENAEVRVPVGRLEPGAAPRLVELMVDEPGDGLTQPVCRRIDEALVVPRSDGVLELHVHGSEAVLRALERAGWLRTSQPLAGASDPVERLLHSALTRQQLALALGQRRVRSLLVESPGSVRGMSGGGLDALVRGIRSAADADPSILDGVRRALADAAVTTALATSCPIVLCGPRNAGKSTLFNRLVGAERATTGPEAGLTRDPVREWVGLSGYPYELVDTAGGGGELLGAAPELAALDARAVDLARREFDRATIRILVVGAAGDERELQFLADLFLPGRTLVVRSKADLGHDGASSSGAGRPGPVWPPVDLEVAAIDPSSGPDLRRSIGEALARLRGLPVPAPVIGTELAALDSGEVEAFRQLIG